MPRSIRTEIVIQAPAEAVWAVLTDFPSHPAWDPFLTRIEGAPLWDSVSPCAFTTG